MDILLWFKRIFASDLIAENEKLNSKLQELEAKNPKEIFYNDKYPKVDLSYLRHETDGDYNIDLRDFYMLNDAAIPTFSGTDDEKALSALKYVISNITYTDDKKEYAYDEYWAFPFQTLKRKKGDCEDGAILLANIMVKSGIPYWKVRLSAGNVTGGGHCYLTYYVEALDYWVILDWCYWPNTLPVTERKNYKDEENYLAVWFSWNRDYCFSQGTSTSVNNLVKKKKPKKLVLREA